MGKHAKTVAIEKELTAILAHHNPMTVRQAYYQLVSRQVIENTRSQYQAVSSILVSMRQEGSIPWGWIEDRLRRPRNVPMWADLADFAETAVRSYRRDVWRDQERLVELWVEKDALSGIFEDEAESYGVTVNVGRGYDGWSSIRNAAARYNDQDRPVSVLYFGDFDPSGEDMFRSLGERLAFFSTSPELVKIALVPEDIETYNLPPDFTKATDTRQAGFVARHGDVAVELDALPVDVLRLRIRESVEQRMDLGALEATRELEEEEREHIRAALR